MNDHPLARPDDFPVLGEWRVTIDKIGDKFIITQRDLHDVVAFYAEASYSAAERILRNLLEYRVYP